MNEETSSDKNEYESLVEGLEGWFDKPLSELPSEKIKLIERLHSVLLGLWDKSDEEGRRVSVEYRDCQNDPARYDEMKFHFDNFGEIQNVKEQIKELELMPASRPLELESKTRQLKELRQQLDELNEKRYESGVAGIKQTTAQEVACLEWLIELMGNNAPQEKNRDIYRQEAQSKFGVSSRGFERKWGEAKRETGNTQWGKPGPKKQ